MRKLLITHVIILLASVILFAVVSWPLPRFLTVGIPASSHNIEQPAWRYGIHGDHLQYLYRFDLMSDMLAGRIDWFRNPYEFNTGNDAERYRPGAYFFPLSGVYALLKPFAGQAMAWNLVLWLSVWLSALFTWGWLRRFTQDRVALAMGVGFALLTPFRWLALFGGSPSGHVLMWLPLLAWGIDVAVREARWWSGGWVGAALLLCFWGDLQVFYFAVLATPLFGFISLFGHGDMQIPWRRWYRVLPLGLLSALLLVAYYLWRREYLSASVMSGGRDWHELRIYSPILKGLWTSLPGINGTLFVGVFALVALAMATLHRAFQWRLSRRPEPRHVLVFGAVVLMVAGVILLALGPNGPFEGVAIRVARKLIPGYEMIRQPTKIMALMPMLLAWLMAVGWTGVGSAASRRLAVRNAFMAILLLGGVAETLRAIDVTVCLIDRDQAAYAAVARDAGERNASPGRVLAVPLWPGDAADSSLPVHWAQRYGLRMLNGYSAAVSRVYVEEQFRRFQSVNQGVLTNSQREALLAMGIDYLVVHENMFPEKVSPFPIQTTLARLSANPHLQLLQQAGPVHAFRINKEPSTTVALQSASPCVCAFPSRRWFAFREESEGGRSVEDPEAVLGQALRLTAKTSGPLRIRPTRLAPRPDLAWWVRTKGISRIRATTHWGGVARAGQEAAVDSSRWGWVRIAIDAGVDYQPVALTLDVLHGEVDIDTILLVGGDWPERWDAGVTRAIPAVCFFHAGYVDEDGTSVVLRPSHEPADVIFYGPGLPLPVGDYRIEPVITWPSTPDPAAVAEFRVGSRGGEKTAWQPVNGGATPVLDWKCADNRPFVFELKYTRQAEIRVHEIRITRRR